MDKPAARRPKTLPKSIQTFSRQKSGAGIFVILISAIVAAVIAIGLWISVSAIAAKVHLSQGARQIIDVVSAAREAAKIDHQIGTPAPQDLIVVLERMGRVTSTGETGGYKSLTNPWGGALYVQAVSATQLRVETSVPPFACVRIAELFTADPRALSLQEIDIRGWNNTWQDIYTAAKGKKFTANSIGASCSRASQAYLAMTFTLR